MPKSAIWTILVIAAAVVVAINFSQKEQENANGEKSVIEKIADSAKEGVNATAEAVKETTDAAIENTAEAASDAENAAKDVATSAVEAAADAANATKETVNNTVENGAKAVENATTEQKTKEAAIKDAAESVKAEVK